MYFGCGGHESFNIDGELNDYRIEFEKEEKFFRLMHDDDGYLTGKTVEYPAGKTLEFKDFPMKNDETLIFKGIKSGWCKLVNNRGETVVEPHFEGFPNLLFWHTEGGAFICIEPWTNLPDVIGEDKDFTEKEGIYPLAAGAERVIKRKIIY